MAIPTYDAVWEQGEDFVMNILYKENDVPFDFTDHIIRMDLAQGNNNSVVFTLNSEDVEGLDGEGNPVDTAGSTDNEISLDANGNITIVISRALTLPGGIIGDRILTNNKYAYDMFLRDPSGKQRKILVGSITVNKSVTLWT